MLELPIAHKADEIPPLRIGVDALELPGFLMSPDALTETLGGVSIEELAAELSDCSGKLVDGHIINTLSPLLVDVFDFDISSIGFSAIRHKSIRGIHDRPHTDHKYMDGAFWLCGETEEDLPRPIEMVTVYDHIKMTPLSIEETIHFGAINRIRRGVVELGWGAYMLSKNVNGARSCHRYGNGGIYARFGEHDEEGLADKVRELKDEAA